MYKVSFRKNKSYLVKVERNVYYSSKIDKNILRKLFLRNILVKKY